MIIIDEFLDFLNYDPLSEVYYPIIQDDNGDIVYGIKVYKRGADVKASLFFSINSNRPAPMSTRINYIRRVGIDLKRGLRLRSRKGVHRTICKRLSNDKWLPYSLINFKTDNFPNKRSTLITTLCDDIEVWKDTLGSQLMKWCIRCAENSELPTADELHAIKTAYLFKEIDPDTEPLDLPF